MVRFSLREHRDFVNIYSTRAMVFASVGGASNVSNANENMQHLVDLFPYIKPTTQTLGSREDAVRRFMAMRQAQEQEKKQETEED